MSLRGKNILLISPEPWDHIFVSKHHYAIHLGRLGNRVFFLNPPGKANNVSHTEYENVFTLNYTGFVKGLRFLPKRLQLSLLSRKYTFLETLSKTTFDVIWTFDNSVFFNLSFLQRSILKIVHIVDMNQDFNFEELAGTADICFGVSEFIVARLRRANTRSFHLHHGLAFHQGGGFTILDNGNRGLKAGYAGNLDLKYIDWPMFDEIVSANQDITFYFAGPFSESNSYVKSLRQRPNVVLLGKIKASDIPCFLREMDILLLFYRVSEFPEQLSNSHKVMEYLGSGKTIVSSWLSDYQNFQKLIEMAKSREELPALLQRVKIGLAHHNSDIMIAQRMNFAMSQTYDSQIERVQGLIEKELAWR